MVAADRGGVFRILENAGNFTPEEYAAEYRRFTAWVPRYGVNLAFVGAGPNGGDLDWTRRFFAKLNERRALGSATLG